LSDEKLRVLVDEQAALQRVATLVARGAEPHAVFAAVTEEVGRLLPVDLAILVRYEPGGTAVSMARWGTAAAGFPVGRRWVVEGKNLVTIVFETGRSARIDSYADASGSLGITGRETGVRSAAGTPIVVDGRVWGAVVAGSSDERPLPDETEERLASFTALLATAIANAESRAGLTRLAEEQAALRRVATLVARGAAPKGVFSAVTEEVARVLPADIGGMGRYGEDGTVTVVATWGIPLEHFADGVRMRLEGKNLSRLVFETGQPSRIDDYGESSGPLGASARAGGARSGVGTPITVEGHLWGVMVACATGEEPLPPDTEERLAQFTELLATAIANVESRAGIARLADEQAALRRIATQVARAIAPEELFAAVAEEVGLLLAVGYAHLGRYEPDGAITIVAAWSRSDDPFPAVGSRWKLSGANVATRVFETGRSARVDRYVDATGPVGVRARQAGFRSAVGSPILVEGRLWGVVLAGSGSEQPLPPDTEARLASITELVATAIANAESSAALAASRARIVAASDATRRHIERDLHDGIQQRLVSLRLELRAAQEAVPPECRELARELSRIGDGLATVLEELREISRGIHPAILSRGGLEPALRVLARRSAVPVEFDLHAVGRLPEPVEVAAYYAVSEALTNAVKHAHASRIHVALEVREAAISLEIRDDGVGGADPVRGSGLFGLSDRIEALDGRFRVTSPPGRGTALLIEIPLQTQTEAV
jgi:signal transduction histidine kinase